MKDPMMQICTQRLVQIPELKIVYVSPPTAKFADNIADKFADFLHSFKVKQ